MKGAVDNLFDRSNPQQKAIVDKFCIEETERQVAYLRARYNLLNYKPQLTCNHSMRAIASYGGELTDGEPFIVLAMKTIANRVGDTRDFIYEEYDFLRHKPGVGDAHGNWKQYCAWLIAHELAHTVIEIPRFSVRAAVYFPKDVTRDRRDHGKFWQEVYRDIRSNYIATQDYHVEKIDFHDYVHHYSQRKGDKHHLTIVRGESPVAFYIREAGALYRSNRSFSRKNLTKHRSVREIKRAIR